MKEKRMKNAETHFLIVRLMIPGRGRKFGFPHALPKMNESLKECEKTKCFCCMSFTGTTDSENILIKRNSNQSTGNSQFSYLALMVHYATLKQLFF